jgi:hypothetical protein
MQVVYDEQELKESVQDAIEASGEHPIFNVPFGEWEKIPRLQAKTLVLFRHGALSQIQPYDI